MSVFLKPHSLCPDSYQGKDCGVSKKHSLVLVNFSKKSENLINLSKKIKYVIRKKFNIELEYEPTFIS